MVNRRHFIKQFGAFSIAFTGFGRALANTSTINQLVDQNNNKGYGPLIKDPNGILDLPKGFSYTMFSQYNETMEFPGKEVLPQLYMILYKKKLLDNFYH